MDIKDFNVYCINLEERQDRWHESLREFSKTPLEKVNRFPAISDSNPIVGCAKSHFALLESCLLTGKHCMVFEDDVQFINNYNELPEYLNELDGLHWDMLYFGANVTTKIRRLSDRLGQLWYAQSTHAYCVNNRSISTILDKSNLIGKHMDLIYADNVVPFVNAFITIPMLAIQRPSFSNIEKRVVNYDWMEGRFYENLGKD